MRHSPPDINVDHEASTGSGSTWPRFCSQRAASQQTIAHAAPSVQPARTSVGQCTPRYTRLTPTSTISTTASAKRYVLTLLRACARASSAARVRYVTAAIIECPLGKLEVYA